VCTLLEDLGYPQDEATLISEDNTADMMIAETETSSAGRFKHTNVCLRLVAAAARYSTDMRAARYSTDMRILEICTYYRYERIRYCSTSFNYADVSKVEMELLEESSLPISRYMLSRSDPESLNAEKLLLLNIQEQRFRTQ